jgi:hypothetical protein
MRAENAGEIKQADSPGDYAVPKTNDASYHRDRALQERDLGLAAACPMAARSHMELSSLHVRRARDLGAEMPRPPLQM